MANYRRGRVNEAIKQEMCDIIGDVKDPRVSGTFLSITMADCTADLKYCKIYYSVIGNDQDKADAQKGLESAAGFIRGQLARRLDLRITPELTFHYDDSISHGAHINDLLKSVLPKEEPRD